MQCLALLVCFAAVGSADALARTVSKPSLSKLPSAHISKFEEFVKQHGKNYQPSSAEYYNRLALFAERSKRIEELNSRPHRLWEAGISHLADHTDEELKLLLGWRGRRSSSAASGGASHISLSQQGEKTLPGEFLNWTGLEALSQSHVPDQGGCGSCWAVASAAMLSAHVEINGGRKMQFSVQELVNCVTNPHHCGGKGGCQGATAELAYDYIFHNGLSSAAQIPYSGFDGSCTNSAGSMLQLRNFKDLSSPGVRTDFHAAGMNSLGMRGWERLGENKYRDLMLAVVDQGPVAVSVGASDWSWYRSGIFNGCSPDIVINHAVLLIGYGAEPIAGRKYWLIQNSWGPDWGEKGRIRLLRTDNEEEYCGIDRSPADGTGCDGGPSQVRVCGMCGILYDSVVPIFKDDFA